MSWNANLETVKGNYDFDGVAVFAKGSPGEPVVYGNSSSFSPSIGEINEALRLTYAREIGSGFTFCGVPYFHVRNDDGESVFRSREGKKNLFLAPTNKAVLAVMVEDTEQVTKANKGRSYFYQYLEYLKNSGE